MKFMVSKMDKYGKRGSKLIKFSDYPNTLRPYLADDDEEYFDKDGDDMLVSKPVLLAGEQQEEEEGLELFAKLLDSETPLPGDDKQDSYQAEGSPAAAGEGGDNENGLF